jgi:hypothetical protein
MSGATTPLSHTPSQRSKRTCFRLEKIKGIGDTVEFNKFKDSYTRRSWFFTKENHRKAGYSVAGLRFEPGISQLQSGRVG